MSRDEIFNKREIFDELKKEFEATVMQELLPGILHNFANPLNGIMGRSSLLQRRARESVKILSDSDGMKRYTLENGTSLLHDIDLITKETDRLFDLFNDVAGKIYKLHDTTSRKINLSELIETEVTFLNFYLDFKHTIEKEFALDKKIPEVTGVPSDYSVAFSALIRHSMKSMKESPLKKLIISTYCDRPYIHVRIEDTGIHAIGMEERALLGNLRAMRKPLQSQNGNAGLLYALSLLKNYGAQFTIDDATEIHTLSIKIPCQD